MSLETVISKVGLLELGLAQMFIARGLDNFNQSLGRQFDTSSIEWLVLSAVALESESGGIRVTDLATRFEVQTTYITAVLNGLRRKGYVRTRRDDGDARVRLTVISTEGKKALAAIEQHVRHTMICRMQGKVSADEIKQYVSVLIKMARAR